MICNWSESPLYHVGVQMVWNGLNASKLTENDVVVRFTWLFLTVQLHVASLPRDNFTSKLLLLL